MEVDLASPKEVTVTRGWTLEKILKGARAYYASDVHLVRGLAPVYRINGEIRPIEGPPLDADSLKKIIYGMLTEKARKVLDDQWQLCFSQFMEGVGRFRSSIYLHAGVPEVSIRICESRVRTGDELGLPPIMQELTRKSNGLILVTGPTGVGKTTTLNYMIDMINMERRAKVITIEDPIEFVHENRKSIIIQQEVMSDVQDFRRALVHVLRQDPDVIVIGEMRDLETIETALIAAETGHLVLATLHTPDSVQTVQRIYSVFPAGQQNSITVQLANSLQAIISQKLLPRADGKGRVIAMEVCIATQAVRNHIREHNPHLIYSELQTGRKYQMRTMDQSLLELYQKGEITYDVAISNAREPLTIKNRSGLS
ncbi:type IV pilus twitching motility protein PilT [Planctomicrobium sp. SH527]|uniref:type IV pilus twitching motility protein PilT n=1 Tax=Planctomicrobium sp. SH527 TaxID=3448123 RepID=UPI003F5B366D